MKKYRLLSALFSFTIVAVLYCSLRCFAQGEPADILRYSVLSPQGTARSMGIGGAMGSVGGDFTSLSVNPAGIGVYRSSEMMITPTLRINSANSNYLGSSLSDNGSSFNVGNLGAVFTHSERGRRYKNSNWKAVSFGIGFNRLADFTKNYAYSGTNKGSASSSGSEIYSVDANSYPGGIFDPRQLSFLGYNTYLIDTFGGFYHTNVPYEAGISQQRIVKERGGISEIALTLGGNYMEQLLLGITVGIQSLRYNRDATYSEVNNSGQYLDVFNNYTATETYRVTGTGINAKLGAIYKFSDKFRIGAAFHTPTAFAMTDDYQQSVTATTYAGTNRADGDLFNYSYSMTTPWKAVASATAILGKIGFITADYETVNYASARMHFNDQQQLEYATNQAIKNSYRSASNVRAGMEIRLSPLSLRGGFGYYGSPYKAYTYNRFDVSGGIGFRFSRAFIDLSYVHSMYSSPEQPYVLPTDGAYTGVVVPTATIKNSVNNVAMTLGFKF